MFDGSNEMLNQSTEDWDSEQTASGVESTDFSGVLRGLQQPD